MDASPFQQFIGPVALRFFAENADLIRFLVIAGVLVGGWMVADGFKSPRHVVDRLFGKGSSEGRGDIPRED